MGFMRREAKGLPCLAMKSRTFRDIEPGGQITASGYNFWIAIMLASESKSVLRWLVISCMVCILSFCWN